MRCQAREGEGTRQVPFMGSLFRKSAKLVILIVHLGCVTGKF
jgi:hypothetical protein